MNKIQNHIEKKFEEDYALLKSFITSSIFSILGYTEIELRYATSKHIKTINEDMDFIYEDSPLFHENGYYPTDSIEFRKLFIANIFIYFNKYLDDIIRILFENRKTKSIYPDKEVYDIFKLLSKFMYIGLHPDGDYDFLEINHKIHKKLLLMHHHHIKGFKYAESKLYDFYHEPIMTNMMPIIRYGIMMTINNYLPLKVDKLIENAFKNNDIRLGLRILGVYFNSIDSKYYTDLYNSFIKSHPICYPLFKNNADIQSSVMIIEFVKFISGDKYIENYVDQYLYE